MVKDSKTIKKVKSEPTIEDIYKKKNPRDHILSLPDTYIGSVQEHTQTMWIFDIKEEKIKKKEIVFVPGFYKTFDELLVNARDHTVRDKTCNIIKVNIAQETGIISVWNNGKGIPAVIHKEHNVYVPELIFGHLLTSTNYDKPGKTVGGKNGYGAKLANIFSTNFIVETIDTDNKKKYTQEFKDNMSIICEPIIENINSSLKSYTQFIFSPDYKRFGLTSLTDDMLGLFIKRVYDLAACTKGVTIFLNDKKLPIKTFKDFIQMHYQEEKNIIYDDLNSRWKIGVVFDSNSGYEQVSFVNGIWTYSGGTHVDYILNQITKKVIEYVEQKHKVKAKAPQIKEQITIFIDSIIDDPSFNSQTKDQLTTPKEKFGTMYEIDNGFMNKLVKTGIIEEVVRFAMFKENSQLKQSDGKKISSLTGIPKLDDAFWAGTRKSKETRLIITEGDSAKSFATSGIEIIGREKYGAWPIRGKFLNVRNATSAQIKNNVEFATFKQIMGLKQDTEYIDTTKLRYGGIIILTDQDLDGSHIKGLIINMLQFFWPSLLKIDGFIQTMCTPIIKAFKKADKKKNPKIFYTLTDYEKWAEHDLKGNTNGWTIKYYKGLGTSDAKEAKEIFLEFEKRIITYIWETTQHNKDLIIKDNLDNLDNLEVMKKISKKNIKKELMLSGDASIYQSKSYDSITLAFDEGRTEDRKKWLSKYKMGNILEYTNQNVSYTDFVDKDLIHFSNYDNIRMIPSLCDGLKPSQRKILFGCFKKNVGQNEIKVAQLASYISEHTAYKHGEVSLQGAIVNMAQNFPGSNNINLLFPSGIFGYRKQGGDDAAQARYIFTYLETITGKIFRKEDEPILKHVVDEGEIVEPEVYAPIIPMILVNGAIGVGYGFATKIPPYDPIDIAVNLLRRIDDKDLYEMKPSWHNFKGKVKKIEQNKFKMTGNYKVINDETIRITEIPVTGHTAWSDKYKLFLESLIVTDKNDTKNIITEVKAECGNDTILFDVMFKGNELQNLLKKGDEEVEKFFKLSTTISTNNFYLYNSAGAMSYYETCEDVINEFYEFRLDMYGKRKAYMLKLLINELLILENKVKFIQDIINEKIIIAKQKKEKILEKLEELKYPKLSYDIYETEDKKTYNYLTNMALFSLTQEKIDELNEEYTNKKNDYELYYNTTLKDLWKQEINEFLDAYKIWNENRNDYNDECIKKGKNKTPKKEKNITKKSKK